MIDTIKIYSKNIEDINLDYIENNYGLATHSKDEYNCFSTTINNMKFRFDNYGIHIEGSAPTFMKNNNINTLKFNEIQDFIYRLSDALGTDILISLGCETMYPLKKMTTANPDCIFACQSSNVFREMYGINCVPTIEDHIENVGINSVIYQGQIEQSYWSWDGKVDFDRFMVIGRK